MQIIVAGPGCHRCRSTEKNVIDACAELRLDAEINHVQDIAQFAALGVMMTPSVLIDGTIVFAGRVPSVAELKTALLERGSHVASGA